VKLGAGDAAVIELPILGQAGVPASATAVLLNITTVNATAPSHLTIWPTGTARPLASSTNFVPGTTVPNAVTAKIGTGGKISIFNNIGAVDVLADVNGTVAGTDLADNSVSSPKIVDGSVTLVDIATDDQLFAVTLANGTTIAPGQCLIRAASSGEFAPAGKLAMAFVESGTIPDNIAFFAATTKITTAGVGVAPFQICNTSTSLTATFTGATFNLRIKVVN
jgi:hypothetical protein